MVKKGIMYRLRILVAIMWGTLICTALLLMIFYIMHSGVDAIKEELKNIITNSNGNTMIVFLIIFFIRGLFFIPSTVLIFIGGALFDPWDAFFLCLIGQMVSSTVLYLISKFVGRQFFLSLENKNEFFHRVDASLTKKGFFATLVLSVIPIVPADTVSVVAGITGISFSDYFSGMFLGSAVFILPFLFLGKTLESSDGILLTLGLFFLLIAVTFWAWNHPHFREFFQKKK